jgi:hypothetical protein
MKMFRRPSLTALCFAFACAASPFSVQARERIQPEFSFGTTGFGAGALMAFPSGDEVRLDASYASLKFNGNGTYVITGAHGKNPVTLDLALSEQIKPGTISLTYDHRLKKGRPLSIDAGIVANLFSADAETEPTASSLIFGNKSYSAAQLGVLGIHARWRLFAPYLGLGWSQNHGARVDLGLYALGAPSIDLTTDSFIAANPRIFGPYLDSLRHQLTNDLSGLTVFPVLRVSVPIGR